MLIVMVCVTLLIYVGALWQYAFNSSIPVINQTAAAALLQDASRIPGFLWGWRFIVLALAVGGMLLAWWERFVQRYPPLWRTGLVAAVVWVAVSALVIARTLTSAEQTVFDGGDASETLATLGQQGAFVWGQLFFGIAITIFIAGIIWLSWTWWYPRWSRWLGLAPVLSVDGRSDVSADEWFARRQSRARARRTVVVALVGALVLLFALVALYDRSRASVQSGVVWVEPSVPQRGVQLVFDRPSRHLFVENSYGSGTVAVALAVNGAATPAPPVALTFTGGRASYERTPVEIGGLPAGVYVLSAQIRSGEGGRVSYALIQQNETLMAVFAVLVGVSVGSVLALVVLLITMRRHTSAT